VLPARHDPWARALFDPYLRRLFRRHFHALRLLGEAPLPDPALPLLIVPNHSSWWDGFFLHFLNARLLGRRLHLMMLEEQLRRFPFFRRVGAFGIRPGAPRAVAGALDYAVAVLADPANALCLFPQGRMSHPDQRPLGFRPGLGWIMTKHDGPLALLPLAMRCDFYEDQRPEALFLFDVCHPLAGGPRPDVQWVEQRVDALLEQVGRAARGREEGQVLLRGRRQLSERRARRRPGPGA
jgi:1-acyl-sn-glycerol-3-phosphate acyltransferase